MIDRSSALERRRFIVGALAMSLGAMAVAVPAAARAGDTAASEQDSLLSMDATIGDILRHPAFAGFSAQILPWDERRYDEDLPLRDIGTLLPYHSHVDPQTVVASLNRMIVDAKRGQRIFYDIYSDEEKQADPTLAHTGLFYFRGAPGAPFALISAGGGFSYVGSVHEGFPYAEAISRLGYNALVLKYRAGRGGAVATRDLAAAVSYVFENADLLDVSVEDYSVWGSSAGARMAALIGSHGPAAFGGEDRPKPAAVIMAYTAHSEVSDDERPTFVVVGDQDGISPAAAMERRIADLQAQGVEVGYRKIDGLGHGFGLGTGTAAEGWIVEATRFWERFIASR